jgi:hypothetical protein
LLRFIKMVERGGENGKWKLGVFDWALFAKKTVL